MRTVNVAFFLVHFSAADPYCPPGEFSVSVVDTNGVQCLAAPPCSGIYGATDTHVGPCPLGSNCGILSEHDNTMRCIPDEYPGAIFLTSNGTKYDPIPTVLPTLPIHPTKQPNHISTIIPSTTIMNRSNQSNETSTPYPHYSGIDIQPTPRSTRSPSPMQNDDKLQQGSVETTSSTSLAMILEIAIGIAVVLAIAAGVFFFRRRRSHHVVN